MVNGAGFGRCLADVLRGDILSGTASAVAAQFPLDYAMASAVPTFMYTCLKDIWLQGTTASGSSPTQWASMVIDALGYGQSGTKTIEVVPSKYLDSIDSPRNFIKDNSAGAEYAEFYVYLKIGGALSPTDSERIVQAELRIRYLLDYNWRVNTIGIGEIPVTDSTIDPNYDNKAYWVGALGKASGLIQEKDLSVCYSCSYRRNVPRKF